MIKFFYHQILLRDNATHTSCFLELFMATLLNCVRIFISLDRPNFPQQWNQGKSITYVGGSAKHCSNMTGDGKDASFTLKQPYCKTPPPAALTISTLMHQYLIKTDGRVNLQDILRAIYSIKPPTPIIRTNPVLGFCIGVMCTPKKCSELLFKEWI